MSADRWELACEHCGQQWARDQTMGVVKAHFEIEHDTGDIRLDLVLLCSGCEKPMVLEHTVGDRHYHGCSGCRRSKVVRQRNVPDG